MPSVFVCVSEKRNENDRNFFFFNHMKCIRNAPSFELKTERVIRLDGENIEMGASWVAEKSATATWKVCACEEKNVGFKNPVYNVDDIALLLEVEAEFCRFHRFPSLIYYAFLYTMQRLVQ